MRGPFGLLCRRPFREMMATDSDHSADMASLSELVECGLLLPAAEAQTDGILRPNSPGIPGCRRAWGQQHGNADQHCIVTRRPSSLEGK